MTRLNGGLNTFFPEPAVEHQRRRDARPQRQHAVRRTAFAIPERCPAPAARSPVTTGTGTLVTNDGRQHHGGLDADRRQPSTSPESAAIRSRSRASRPTPARRRCSAARSTLQDDATILNTSSIDINGGDAAPEQQRQPADERSTTASATRRRSRCATARIQFTGKVSDPVDRDLRRAHFGARRQHDHGQHGRHRHGRAPSPRRT